MPGMGSDSFAASRQRDDDDGVYGGGYGNGSGYRGASQSQSNDWTSWALNQASSIASQGIQTASVVVAKTKEVASTGMSKLQDSGYIDVDAIKETSARSWYNVSSLVSSTVSSAVSYVKGETPVAASNARPRYASVVHSLRRPVVFS